MADEPQGVDGALAAVANEDRLLESLRLDPRRVVLVGNYGSVNLGDDLLLKVISGWVKEAGGSAVAVSVNPVHTREAHQIDAVWYGDLAPIVETFSSADLLVLGGGGLFQDYDPLDPVAARHFPAFGATQFAQYAYLAETLGVPRVALAQGVGPLRSEPTRALVRDVYQRMGSISVRDPFSAAVLREIGVELLPRIAPDPTWSWCKEKPGARTMDSEYPTLAGRKVLAVILRDWPFDAEWEDAFLRAFRTGLSDEWSCLWIDFFRAPLPEDSTQPESVVAHRLIDRLGPAGRHVIWSGSTIEQAYAAIAQCDAVVAMRMHALLLAHLAGVPSVAIEYEDKVRSMNNDLGMPASQRLSIEEIEQRLPSALQVVTGVNRDEAFRVSGRRALEIGRAALGHRDVLWHAMSAAKKSRAPAGGERRFWLTEWHPDAPTGVRRVMNAVEARLHRQIAASAILETENAELTQQICRADAENHRLAGALARTDMLRIEERNARVTQAEATRAAETQVEEWRSVHNATINSSCYRVMAPTRWVKRAASRLWDLVGKGVATARADGMSVAGRMAVVKMKRAISRISNSGAEFSEELRSILERYAGRRIVVLLPVMDWDVPLFQRPQHMARALANGGFLYFYCLPGSRDGIHGFREAGEGLVLTDQLDLLQSLPDAKLWHLYSTETVHDLSGLRSRMHRGDAVLYEYIDELHESIARRTIPSFVLERHRALLLDERVFVVGSADRLHGEIRAARVRNFKLVTNGVDIAHFSIRRGEMRVPPALAAIIARGRPIIGYFGALASVFDFALLGELSRRRPDLEFALIGPDYGNAPSGVDCSSLSNVHRLGRVPYQELPRWACWFDVGMIPFKTNAITEGTSPLNLFEYMALGLPIVATDLRECYKYSSVLIGRNTDAFVALVDRALALRSDASYQKTLAREAADNAWSIKGKEVAELVRPASSEGE